MTVPYLHKCAKCGESWWDAHVCATDAYVTPIPSLMDGCALTVPAGQYKVMQLPMPVGWWTIGGVDVGGTRFAVYKRPTDEQIKNTEALLGWDWKEAI